MPRRTAPTRSEQGFTLVELLVVVLVLAVLAAIAIPVYIGQQRGARDSSVVSDVHNTGLGVAEWVLRNGGSAVAGTAAYESAGGRVVRSGTNTVDVVVSGSGAYTVCGYTSDGSGTYRSSTNAWLYTSTTGKAAASTAGCPGAGAGSTTTSPSTAPTATAPTVGTVPGGGAASSSPTPTPTPTADVWVDCAVEWGTCSFLGTRSVRYGLAPSSWATRTITGSTPCTNDVFGDPAYGYGKQCQYLR